jgi:hypothetical protein
MAKAAPKRSDFPNGMMGQAKYEAALKRYKASYGPPAPKPPKPTVNRRGRMTSPYKDGQIVTKEGNQFRYNAKTKQFTLVKKPAPSKPAATTTPAAKPQKAGVAPVQPKPKPKPKPAMSAAAQGYQKDLAEIKKVEKKAAAFKAAQERKKELEKLREEAKQKSLKIGRANRSRRNTTARGPRDR